MKNILLVFVCLSTTIAINAQTEFYASSDDLALIDFIAEEDSEKEETYCFKAGIMHTDSDAETISLTYVDKDENYNYTFLIKNKEGNIFKEFKFIELKESDISLTLDFSGLKAGPYIVEILKDQLLNTSTVATTDK